MNTIKKLIAAAAAAVSAGTFSMASVIASAEETTTTTTETTVTTEETTTTETTTETTTNTSDTTTDTTTSTTAPSSYSAWLSIGGNKQQDNVVSLTANGTYTAKYKFEAADVSSAITSLTLESDINSESVSGVKFKVTGIKLGIDEQSAETVNFTNTADDVFGINSESKLYCLNIINTQQTDVKDLAVDMDKFVPMTDDMLFVTFTVEGIPVTQTSSTTTTYTRTISYVGYNNNNSNNNSSTSTVSKTADEGVIAVIVSALAAAALAGGAMTIRRKRK